MPRQPNPNQIPEAKLSPSMRAATISPGVSNEIGAGGRAMGAAISDLGNAFGQIAARGAETADRQNDARFGLAWTKAQHNIHNEINQNAGEKGTGWEQFAPRLKQEYERLNKEYAISGENRQFNREINASKDIFKRGQQALNTRIGMERKYYQGIEEKEIGGVIQWIKKNPSDANFNDLEAKARQLVESGLGTYYTKADVEKRTRDVLGTLTTARFGVLLEKEPETAKNLLDEVAKARYRIDAGKSIDSYVDYRGRKGPAAIRFNNPGAQYPGPSANRFGTTGTEIIGGGHKIAVFPTAVHGAAAHLDLLNRRYAGMRLDRLVTKWGGGNSSSSYAKNVSKKLGIPQNTVITKDMLSDPSFAVPFAKAMASHEAGKGYPLSDGQWRAAFDMFRNGSPNMPTKANAPEAEQPTQTDNNVFEQPNSPDLASLVPQEAMQALQGIASDTPNAKLSEALSPEQMKALKGAGLDVSKMTVSQALEMAAGGAIEAGAGDLNAAQEAEQKRELNELPSGRLEDGQVFTTNSKLFGAMTFAAEHFNAVPRKLLSGLRKKATELARIRAREQQVIADDMMQNQLETVRQTGKSHSEWNAEVVRDAYGKSPKAIAKFNKRLAVAKEVHEVVGNSDNLPNDALEARLNDLETKALNATGDADPQIAKAYEMAQRRVKKLLRQRTTDPAASVNATEEVREAIKQIPGGRVKTKQDAYGLVDARMRAQVRLGLPKTPISKREANDLIAPVAAAPQAQKMEAAKELARKIYKIYGDHAPLVIESATRLSSLDSSDDRDMISNGKFYAERDAKMKPKPADTNSDVEQAIDGKMQGRRPSGTPARNPFDQFE